VATNYQQPSRINSVSLGLAGLLGLAIWIGASAWPLVAVNANIKNELNDALPRAYRSNLRPEPVATREIADLHEELTAKLAELGLTAANSEVVIERGEKKISIEVRYQSAFILKGLHKSYPFSFNPRVETDAARVEW
jgi:hypothetical protein